MAIIDEVEKMNIPHFIWAFTPLFLDEEKNNFRTWVNFGVEANHYIKFIDEKSPKRIALVHANIIGTSIQFNEVIIPYLEELGISYLNEAYDVSKRDFKDLTVKVNGFNPDLIIINGFIENLVPLVKDFMAYNITKDRSIMGSFDLLDVAPMLDHSLTEGMYVTAPHFLLSEDQIVTDFKRNFFAKHNRPATYTDAYAYDMATIIINAAKESKLKNITLNQALMDIDILGVTGPLRFQNNGELEHNLIIGNFINGELKATNF